MTGQEDPGIRRRLKWKRIVFVCLFLLCAAGTIAAFALFSRGQIDTDHYRFLNGYSPVRITLGADGSEFDAQGYESRTYFLKGDFKSIRAKAEAELSSMGYKVSDLRDYWTEWRTGRRAVMVAESTSENTLVYCSSGVPDGLWMKLRIVLNEAAKPYRDDDYGLVKGD